MAQRRGKLSVAHRYGIDNANGGKEVFALTLIHIFRSKALAIAFLGAFAGYGLVSKESFKEAIQFVFGDERSDFGVLELPREDDSQ